MSNDRRSQLLGIKLRALIAEHLRDEAAAAGLDSIGTAAFPSGASLVLADGAWVLIDGPADRSLGGALAWALRQGASSLDLVAEHDTGLLARRAAAFSFPIRVWFAQERTLLAAVPEPLRAPPEPPSPHLALAGLIESGGATPNVEHGVVTGEVRGLEVCRVVSEPTLGRLTDEHGEPLSTGTEVVAPDGDDGVILEVGVGANDREAFQLLHGHVPKAEALADVVESVRMHRAPDAPAHPLNRMAPERALRAAAIDDPTTIGLSTLEPSPPPVPRPSMKDVAPCVSVGRNAAGEERTVVFSAGVDLELAPFIADVIAMGSVGQSAAMGSVGQSAAMGSAGQPTASGSVGQAPPVVVVLPERDRLPIVERLLGVLDHPVSIVHVRGGGEPQG